MSSLKDFIYSNLPSISEELAAAGHGLLIKDNIFGGESLVDGLGRTIFSTVEAAGTTRIMDSAGTVQGFSFENIFGGNTFRSLDGTSSVYTTPNIFGGMNTVGPGGDSVMTMSNIFGGDNVVINGQVSGMTRDMVYGEQLSIDSFESSLVEMNIPEMNALPDFSGFGELSADFDDFNGFDGFDL